MAKNPSNAFLLKRNLLPIILPGNLPCRTILYTVVLQTPKKFAVSVTVKTSFGSFASTVVSAILPPVLPVFLFSESTKPAKTVDSRWSYLCLVANCPFYDALKDRLILAVIWSRSGSTYILVVFMFECPNKV